MLRFLVALTLFGCNSIDPIVLPGDMAKASAAAPDLTTQSDLAWTDLAGGVDIAQAMDASNPVDDDMAQALLDLSCAYSIGSSCSLNTQCACTTRQTCDITGDSYPRCCVYMGDNCTSNAHCCKRPGVGNGFCVGSKCQ
jgi:hypothetical protein